MLMLIFYEPVQKTHIFCGSGSWFVFFKRLRLKEAKNMRLRLLNPANMSSIIFVFYNFLNILVLNSYFLIVLAGLGSRSRSRVFLAPWSRSRLKKKAGAGAAWKKSQEP